MYLGINLSHGSSACLVDAKGNLISAIEEERISRNKNHYGIPYLAIGYLVENAPEHFEIQSVIHGSFQQMNEDSLIRILANADDSPSNPIGTWKLPRPGWKRPDGDAHELIEKEIGSKLAKYGISNPEHKWIKHHDAHLGTALSSAIRSGKRNSLLITLDGEGDGESGTVALARDSQPFRRLASYSHLDSLGYLYQAVTERYNFKGNQHEGKITGLAAFGKWSAAVEVLASYIQIEDGVLSLKYTKNMSQNRLVRSLKQIGLGNSLALSLQEIVDLAASQTEFYEDLAFAVQHVLEASVVEIADFWLRKTGSTHLCVSGGVFANVKMNQRISELEYLEFFDVFPNMGDGGLSAGAVWAHLSNTGQFASERPYQDMFLAAQTDKSDNYLNNPKLIFEKLTLPELSKKAANLISKGKFIGLHYGKMEFGPRALGHRSLLLDPRERSILKIANERLRRTEFMPFAPVVLRENFEKYFIGNLKDRPGFGFMTMTCNVKDSNKHQIPAVTHVDNTARPQVVDYLEDDLYSSILYEFEKITGVGVLVNTSLNVHETPINFDLKDSIQCLEQGAIDFIVTDQYLISLKASISG